MIKRYSYKIKGQVQGVGFRPFIYNIAIKYNLIGYIRNNEIGVYIEVEGEEKDLNLFHNNLKMLPPLAKITFLKKEDIPPLYKGQFEIIHSELQSSLVSFKIASVPPDVAICYDCLLDIKSSKKYQDYFATNCTNCGPRYSIIQTVPYDRENTSMSKFIMCNSCKDQYNNPLDRRYHAQPIGCNKCGTKLSLYKKKSIIDIPDIKKIKLIKEFIQEGKIGAIKGIGGFHIVCDATNNITIQKLRKYKNRPTKPFALMCKDISMIKEFAILSRKEEELLESKEAPIVILNKLSNHKLDKEIAPNINKIGCMLPYTAFHHMLFQYLDTPIIATSANLAKEPIITTKNDIENKLSFIDFIVDYDRDIINFVDDSIVQVIDNKSQILRLSRGYAPKEIKIPFILNKKILALGANQKSTISLAFDDKIILSPYIGDIDSLKSIEALNKTLDTFKKFYNFKPDIILCDKHPNYETTKIAKQLQNENIQLIQVQHHLAHLYSVKAEYNLQDNKYIGFIFDGTGLGDDNKLWGGEVFVNEKRKYHFKPIKLLGGEKAIKESKRVALSLLFENYSLENILTLDIPTIKAFKDIEIKLLHNMWKKNLNSPQSSSVGRLFDAVASICGICQIQSYEGEAGLLTQQTIDFSKLNINDSFNYNIKNNIINIKFDFFDKNLIEKFYATLVKIVIDLSIKENLDVILSGGVFQNSSLLEFIIKELKIHNIKYYYNKDLPTNDSGISVGQIWHSLSKIK